MPFWTKIGDEILTYAAQTRKEQAIMVDQNFKWKVKSYCYWWQLVYKTDIALSVTEDIYWFVTLDCTYSLSYYNG